MVRLEQLTQMKLVSYRDQDRIHLRDMIEIDLIGRNLVRELPPQQLARRPEILLGEAGR